MSESTRRAADHIPLHSSLVIVNDHVVCLRRPTLNYLRQWKRRYNEDLPTSEGATLGGELANLRREDGKPDSAKNRPYRMLITETTHLIWVL